MTSAVDERRAQTDSLTPHEKALVYGHARRWFPELVGAATAFDALPVLDHETSRPWFGRPVDEARYFSSSGTSGEPKRIPWLPSEDAWYVGQKQELFGPWLGGCRRGFISLAVGHNAGSAHLVFEHLGLDVHDAGLSDVTEQCAAVLSFEPDVLYCSPSILIGIVDAMERTGQRPTSVRRVITNGEVLYPAIRARFQRFFGLAADAVMDTYGSTEVGTLAFSCPRCSDYHFLDGLYPEAVLPARLPPDVRPPGAGHDVLAISSLKRTSVPIVRFLTYDVLAGLRRTVCGTSERFSFQRVVGRCDDVVNYGELFSVYELADLIGGALPGARWYVFSPCNDLSVVIEGAEPDGFREELARRYPLHAKLIDLGLVPAPVLRFVERFDEFMERAGLVVGARRKDVRRILTCPLDEGWLAGLTADA